MPPPEQVCTDRQTTPKHNASSPIYWMVKGSLYSTTERRVLELIPVLGNQPAGEVSHTPSGRLPLLCARPAVTPTTLNRLLPISLLGEQRHNRSEQFA